MLDLKVVGLVTEEGVFTENDFDKLVEYVKNSGTWLENNKLATQCKGISLDEIKHQIANYIKQQNSKSVFKPATEIELISFIRNKLYEEGH